MNGRDKIVVDNYKSISKNKDIPGQAHHLNQNAAFRDVIPKGDGLAIKLKGNIRMDVGSPHYNAHKTLEEFWDAYRVGGIKYRELPTIKDYNIALKQSLLDAGLSKSQVRYVLKNVIMQQQGYGLNTDILVPRIPGKIHLPK